MHPDLLDPIDYRKSGLSLNHVVGCPLDCAYCVRHLFGNYNLKTPTPLMDDGEAVRKLVEHPLFRPHLTPLQFFNRATDPFLPTVKPHTFAVLRELDRRGLTNHVLVITRYHVTRDDCAVLNSLNNIRLTLLVTWSGIQDRRLEPVSSRIAAQSLRTAFEHAERYRTVLYWRPIVAGLNDRDEDIAAAEGLAATAHATVFTGLFFRNEIQAYYRDAGLPMPYGSVARRKILPERTEERILAKFRGRPLFRKTSCAVAFAHKVHDYNGHYGVPDICDICPAEQRSICREAHERPTERRVAELLRAAGRPDAEVAWGDGALITSGLADKERYFLQHSLSYQVHDGERPHLPRRHGRAEIGWSEE